jgi:predicted SAM-dependent methyltransferase
MRMPKIFKVNLGCGPSGIEGWINLDWGILPWLSKNIWLRDLLIRTGVLNKSYDLRWPDVRLFDIRKRLPFNDKSIDFIYCSHVLEHFEKYQILSILKESRRVLKDAGVLRIVIPDIEKIIKLYQKSGEADEFSEYVWGYNRSSFKKTMLDKIKEKFIRGHQWCYDFKSMGDILKTAGFENISNMNCGVGLTLDIKKLDLREHEKESIYIEAR